MQVLPAFKVADGDSHTTIAGHNLYTITVLPSGQMPRYVALSTNDATGLLIAAGDSAVSAITNPQFSIIEGQTPLLLDVMGMTHIAVLAAGVSSLIIAKLGN